MNTYKKSSRRNKNELVFTLCCFVCMLLCIIFTPKCNIPYYIIISDILHFINQIINITFYGTKETFCKIYPFPNIYITFSLKYSHASNSYSRAYVTLVYKK